MNKPNIYFIFLISKGFNKDRVIMISLFHYTTPQKLDLSRLSETT